MMNVRLFDALAARALSVEGQHFPVRAPAKVNLRLRVLGRFPNGYHDLSMVNGSISLADEIVCSFNAGCGVELTIVPPLVDTPVGQNLITKVVLSFVGEFLGGSSAESRLALTLEELPFTLSATVTKRIPTGGGLGGGSSDAAAVLRILVTLFAADICQTLGIKEEEFLRRVLAAALRCGSDIPYSFFGGFAWVRGIGERVAPFTSVQLSDPRVLVVIPPFASDTKEFYSAYRERIPAISGKEEWEQEFRAGSLSHLPPILRNDFESVLCELYPAMGVFLGTLRRFFPDRASITGSGSTLFTILQGGDEAALGLAESEISKLGGASLVASWERSPGLRAPV